MCNKSYTLREIFDFAYFLQNNTNIKHLAWGGIVLSPEQGNIIATALDGMKLRTLDMYCFLWWRI
jgi:hypothetical protein